jgi:hypothetical protein
VTRVALVRGGREHPALDAMARAAARGAVSAGGQVVEVPGATDPERALECDALLLAATVSLFAMPSDLAALFEAWRERIPGGTVVPRTARMKAGYLAVYDPDEPAQLELFHRQVRSTLAFFGARFVGRAAAHLPPGAGATKELLLASERLGAALAGEGEASGWPAGYLDGVRLFNEGRFFEAHEAWEEIWIEEEGPKKLFWQGLIQVAGAFHHHGNANWAGMGALMKEGRDKLARFRPRAMGLDVDAFLEALEPWRLLAEARRGRGASVTRVPESLPKIELSPEA